MLKATESSFPKYIESVGLDVKKAIRLFFTNSQEYIRRYGHNAGGIALILMVLNNPKLADTKSTSIFDECNIIPSTEPIQNRIYEIFGQENLYPTIRVSFPYIPGKNIGVHSSLQAYSQNPTKVTYSAEVIKEYIEQTHEDFFMIDFVIFPDNESRIGFPFPSIVTNDSAVFSYFGGTIGEDSAIYYENLGEKLEKLKIQEECLYNH